MAVLGNSILTHVKRYVKIIAICNFEPLFATNNHQNFESIIVARYRFRFDIYFFKKWCISRHLKLWFRTSSCILIDQRNLDVCVSIDAIHLHERILVNRAARLIRVELNDVVHVKYLLLPSSAQCKLYLYVGSPKEWRYSLRATNDTDSEYVRQSLSASSSNS